MVLFALLAPLCAAVVVVLAATRPATGATRRRTATRRARYVAEHPTHVNSADVVRALVGAGMPPEQAHLVVRHASAREIRPFTLWLWSEQHGPTSLALVVAAGLTQAQLLAHLGAATAPDVEELRLFAALSGPEGLCAVDRDPAVAPGVRRRPLRPGLAA